jgi:hypothetical protein
VCGHVPKLAAMNEQIMSACDCKLCAKHRRHRRGRRRRHAKCGTGSSENDRRAFALGICFRARNAAWLVILTPFYSLPFKEHESCEGPVRTLDPSSCLRTEASAAKMREAPRRRRAQGEQIMTSLKSAEKTASLVSAEEAARLVLPGMWVDGRSVGINGRICDLEHGCHAQGRPTAVCR